MRRLSRLMAMAVWAGAASVSGCATSGVGSGQVIAPGKPGAEGDAVFTWEAEADATQGTIRAALPDGRVFTGRFVQVTSVTSAHGFGPDDEGLYGAPYRWDGASAGVSDAFVRTHSGRVLAQLEGPGDERMRCQFVLAQPEAGPASGGIGDCQLSTGERIGYATLRGEDE